MKKCALALRSFPSISLFMFWFLISCSPSFSPVLIEMENWRFGDLETDPLRSHQPETVECTASAFRLESEQLEIQTDLCNYVFLEFDLLQDLEKGTPADFLLLHTGLWAPEIATAHAALLIDGSVFWEQEATIPSSAEFFFFEGEIPVDAHIGDPIQLHIHNHGANDWRLGYFRRMEED